MDETIWLVGMMGAGKSSVGRVLARELGCAFVDTDEEVARTAGRSLPEIFENDGEAAFRRLERDAITTAGPLAAVVALGGGAIAQPGTAELLARTGIVVYLRAELETLERRIGDAATRPLLRKFAPEARRRRLAELLEERGVSYESAAIVVDTDDLSLSEVAERLVAQLDRRNRQA